MLSIPVIGTWVTSSIFGGEFPGDIIISRFYIVHVLLIPALLLALITVHLGLVFKQKHTQWPGPGRTNNNVVGERMFPRYALKQGGFFMIVFGVIALMGGLFQINPIWLFGPYEACGGLLGQPARLVRHVPRRLDPADAGLADQHPDRRRVRHPAAVLADRGAARAS